MIAKVWLKACLEHRQIPFRKTHKLQTLLDLCKIKLDPQEDELYIESRYLGEFGLLLHGKSSTQEIKTFFDFAKRFHLRIKEMIDA